MRILLTNDDGVLPLARTQRVALIGRHAIETIDMGGGLPIMVGKDVIGAIAVGLLAGVLCAMAVGLKFRFGFDDSLDVVGVHLVGGVLGALFVMNVIGDVAGTYQNRSCAPVVSAPITRTGAPFWFGNVCP